MPLEPDLIPTPGPGDCVIAADGGYASLYQRGIAVDLVVGDFDSLGSVPNHPEVLRLPRIKDETDMGYALNRGLEKGYTRFLLLGGMGGRLEHTIANLQLLCGLSQRGAAGILAGNGQAAAVITNGSFVFPDTMSGFCSVFCQSGTARGVTLEGLKYPLEQEELTGSFPLGVSNEFLGVPARVSVEEGSLLLIWETHGQLMNLLPTLLK
jgi:thiamine pyrophosphokinase